MHNKLMNFQGGWRFHKFREDKSGPNGLKTALNVRKTIFDKDLLKDKLIEKIKSTQS